ncbi:MAG: hypothetical protein G01um101433_242 [Parcubacteria group bacterium Gr01-1014_33]|nr:MAG: hypothetical protein G01um101433_242 [Parcubacteria group bacterium Gr01-1014_33]
MQIQKHSALNFSIFIIFAVAVAIFIISKGMETVAEIDSIDNGGGMTLGTTARERQNMQGVDTFTWKTYRNEKYGFEVRYPSAFIAYTGFSGEEPIEADATSDRFWITRNNGLLRRGEPLTIGTKVIADMSFTPREWLDENKENYTSLDEIKLVRNIEFAGKNAVELEGGCNIASVCKMYVLRISPDYLIVITNADGKDLDQILSTFKFIK